MRFATLALSMVWALSAQTPFRAKPEGSIGGIVRDAATGTPLVDAAVRVWRVVAIEGGTIPQISDREWTSTEGGGRYRIPKAGIGDIEVTARAGGHTTVSRKAHLDADADLTLDFDLPPNPTISGHVLDENKKPTSALVWLIASEYRSGLLLRRRIGPGMADETGHFAFDSDLEAGRSYYLLAERPVTRDRAIAPKPLEEREEVDESTYYGDVHSLRDATPITLRPGQHYDVADIKIHKAKPYCVDGRTKLAGEPASVSIGIREAAMAEISLTPLEFESADDGSFHVCGLTPGEYALVPVKSQRSGLTAFTISNADLENIQLTSILPTCFWILVGMAIHPPNLTLRCYRAWRLVSVPGFQQTARRSWSALRTEPGRKWALAPKLPSSYQESTCHR